MVAATPCTAPIALKARARLAPSNMTRMEASTCGISMAAAAPGSRARHQNPDRASPQISDDAVNSPMPHRKIRRRPKRSPSRAPVISSTASAAL